ncbi:hypothetical protein RSOL_384490 [Rhizoctonia solani AG-3 Rhs1AP]|uniref:F-box domain-containing protein n=1 Tax=Rhizoctonia solani AG-3 Rhs1AP TaxID=1086054 RepID=X8JBX1_9AGAM|nr:hypothetical protein RSOL_384490 [Rhizoctonia solani AG-3 Rhs1AP]
MTKKLKLKLKASNEVHAPPLPINLSPLPTEVLAYIFQLVLLPRSQPCFSDNYSETLNYPEVLLWVCSRWRHVALTSPNLWSHIDIVLSSSASQRASKRAEAFLERAGRCPLDIYIFEKPRRSRWPLFDRSDDELSEQQSEPDDSDCSKDSNEYGSDLLTDGSHGSDDAHGSDDSSELDVFDFLPQLPGHALVKSIQFVTSTCDFIYGSRYLPVLKYYLANCSPGTLTKLVLQGNADDGVNFIIRASEQSEALWLPITTLHVSGGICPSYEGAALRGLTDLRLSGRDYIHESQFANILRWSPKLRIFQFYLKMTAASIVITPVEPIHLNDLEVLDLIENRLKGAEFEMLTRWIAVGQTPLRLFLWCPLDSKPVKKFFRRANVVELHVRLHGTSVDSLEKLLNRSSKLRMLAVDGYGGRFEPKSETSSDDSTRSFTPIDTLHLRFCDIRFDSLQRMIQARSIHTLTMWSCSVIKEKYGDTSREEILGLCSTTKILTRKEFTEMENWIKCIT